MKTGNFRRSMVDPLGTGGDMSDKEEVEAAAPMAEGRGGVGRD